MLFLQVFIRISLLFAGFSEQHQGSSVEEKFSTFLRAKAQILLIEIVIKFLRVPVWHTNSYNVLVFTI